MDVGTYMQNQVSGISGNMCRCVYYKNIKH